MRAAIRVLKEHGAKESNIVFVNLFASYNGKGVVCGRGHATQNTLSLLPLLPFILLYHPSFSSLPFLPKAPIAC